MSLLILIAKLPFVVQASDDDIVPIVIGLKIRKLTKR